MWSERSGYDIKGSTHRAIHNDTTPDAYSSHEVSFVSKLPSTDLRRS